MRGGARGKHTWSRASRATSCAPLCARRAAVAEGPPLAPRSALHLPCDACATWTFVAQRRRLHRRTRSQDRRPSQSRMRSPHQSSSPQLTRGTTHRHCSPPRGTGQT
eukprot:6180447-Pleurochrysis_carterae.AAC.2